MMIVNQSPYDCAGMPTEEPTEDETRRMLQSWHELTEMADHRHRDELIAADWVDNPPTATQTKPPAKRGRKRKHQSTTPKNAQLTIESKWKGTAEAWQMAVKLLGIGVRKNQFTDTEEIFFPIHLIDRRNGGGRWIECAGTGSDEVAKIISLIEQNVEFETEMGDCKIYEPVSISVIKERTARKSLAMDFAFNPFNEYFNKVKNIWDGNYRIATSMEDGGMQVDAGPFTNAVQSIPWIQVAHYTLFPGSSRRVNIVLHGDHECGKSKFVELMLPPHLKKYWSGSFSLHGDLKQRLEMTKGKALLECGEMGQGGPKDWKALKQWLTLPEINGVRMAYAEKTKRHKLAFTTIFTTNEPELPPMDDAALSRFVWVKVLTPATRRYSPNGDPAGKVWQHFDDPADPARPELGTYRDQCFAEAMQSIKRGLRQKPAEDIDNSVEWESDPQLFPSGTTGKQIIAWNKTAGSTFATDQSVLVDYIIDALPIAANYWNSTEYQTAQEIPIGTFIPTKEIKAAAGCIAFEERHQSMHALTTAITHKQAVETKIFDYIQKMMPDRMMGNVRAAVAKHLGVPIGTITKKRHSEPSRGWIIGDQ